MREKYYLDNDWYFSEKWEAAQGNAEYDEAAMQSVWIPHTVKELPFHYLVNMLSLPISACWHPIHSKKASPKVTPFNHVLPLLTFPSWTFSPLPLNHPGPCMPHPQR